MFPRQFDRFFDQFDQMLSRRDSVSFNDTGQGVSGVVSNLGNEAKKVGPREGFNFETQVDQVGAVVTGDCDVVGDAIYALQNRHRVR